MQLGIVGLGRMGLNMARRLVRANHEVIAYNRSEEKTKAFGREGGRASYSYQELVHMLAPPRTIWFMLPAGEVTENAIAEVAELLSPGDLIVDGANNRYTEDQPRAERLAQREILYLDAGVSGGVWGLENGYCTMLGGPREAFERLEPVLMDLAPPEGYMLCGGHGAGHYVKMIHNGIEYGMMQAYAEGFNLIEHSDYADSIDYAALSHLWNQGSVVRSWLLELAELAFAESPRLAEIAPYVDDSGEGRWTVEAAVAQGVSAPVLTLALFERFKSRDEFGFGERVLAALRNQFGGHAVKKQD